jgi:hypothetical protein
LKGAFHAIFRFATFPELICLSWENPVLASSPPGQIQLFTAGWTPVGSYAFAPYSGVADALRGAVPAADASATAVAAISPPAPRSARNLRMLTPLLVDTARGCAARPSRPTAAVPRAAAALAVRIASPSRRRADARNGRLRAHGGFTIAARRRTVHECRHAPFGPAARVAAAPRPRFPPPRERVQAADAVRHPFPLPGLPTTIGAVTSERGADPQHRAGRRRVEHRTPYDSSMDEGQRAWPRREL